MALNRIFDRKIDALTRAAGRELATGVLSLKQAMEWHFLASFFISSPVLD